MNIHDTEYKIQFSYVGIVLFLIGIGSAVVLFFVGMFNNISSHRYWLALICGLIAAGIFRVIIRGLRKEVNVLRFSDEGIDIYRPAERLGIFGRKPVNEFVRIHTVEQVLIKFGYRSFTRFYISTVHGEIIEVGISPADPTWLSELKEFIERRKIPLRLKVEGPDR